jgi:hypothetical protein
LRFSGRITPSIISPQINIKIEKKNIVLPVASEKFENLSLPLREDYGLMVKSKVVPVLN